MWIIYGIHISNPKYLRLSYSIPIILVIGKLLAVLFVAMKGIRQLRNSFEHIDGLNYIFTI